MKNEKILPLAILLLFTQPNEKAQICQMDDRKKETLDCPFKLEFHWPSLQEEQAKKETPLS